MDKAEEYRQSVTAPKRETIDLGKIHGGKKNEMPSEHDIRGIDKPEPTPVPMPKKENTVDLGKQFEEKGKDGVQQPKEENWNQKEEEEVVNNVEKQDPNLDVQEGELGVEELNATPENPIDLSESLPTKDTETTNEPGDVELTLEEVQAKLHSLGVPNHDQYKFEDGVDKLIGLGAL